RRRPTSTRLPYTTLFRSAGRTGCQHPLETDQAADSHADRGWAPGQARTTAAAGNGVARQRELACGTTVARGGGALAQCHLLCHRSEEHTSELQSRENLVC